MSNNKLEGSVERLGKLVHPQQPIPDPPSHSPVGSHSLPPPLAKNMIKPKQDEKEDQNKNTDEKAIEKLAAIASEYHRGLGQVLAALLSAFKEDKFSKCTAEKDMLSIQLKESEQQNLVLSDLNENTVKKCEEDIGKAKSEEAIYKAKYMELCEQLNAVEKKSLEKDTLISSLRAKEMALKEEKAKVEALEMNEKKLKEDVIKKEKAVLMVEERYRKKCQQNVKLSEEMDIIRASANKLQTTVNQYVECDKMDKITISDLRTERDSLKLSVENISCELEKERNYIKVKVVELEKNAREISDLKKEVNVLQEEKMELPKKFETLWAHARDSFFSPNRSQDQHLVSTSSLPSDEKSTPESSSMAVEMNEDNKNDSGGTATEADQLEVQKDVAMTTTPVKTKHSGNCTANSTGKKRREDNNFSTDPIPTNYGYRLDDYPLDFEQISQVHFNKKLKIVHDTEKPEVRTSSRNRKVLIPAVTKNKQTDQAVNSKVNMKK